jgi:hypothetical protein
MHRNPIWISFLAILALSISMYTGSTCLQIYDYSRLNVPVLADRVKWSIKSEASDSFVPHAEYTFTYDGHAYEGQTLFSTHYLNNWATLEAIQKMDKTAPIWINPSNPSHSTLQKQFPLKATFYTALLWGLLTYFLLLGRYVAKGFKL